MLSKIDPMESMVSIINELPKQQVSKIKYEDFKKHWVFYALNGKRYGQAFCEHFEIPRGTPLYYFRDNKLCEKWIEDNYIE